MQALPSSSGVIVVDLDALARNYRMMVERARPAECSAVVKANAYGLGVGPVASRLAREGCRRFFVANPAEGLELRGILPAAQIYVLDGAQRDSVAMLTQANLVPVLNSLEQIAAWAPTGRAAALHVDTGMSRLGLAPREVAILGREPQRLNGIAIDHVMTHLACADRSDHPLNGIQLERFDRLRASLPAAPTSIANSAGLFLGAAHCGDLVRPGIGLYGGNPFCDRDNPFEEVVSLQARVLQLREVDDAVTVGYGATYDAQPPARLATVGIGYADGYRRVLGNRGFAVCTGARVPVVGRVSMDYLCLDVTAVPANRVEVGQPVWLIGGGVSLDDVAAAAGTIGYEILTGLGARLRREYRESE
jgi:alanine racemase